ncbi:MAG: phage holin family protein [Burkholderiales bacterium]|nr:phage holin family protein [Burkholderiales bacterium]MDE2395447.1 phage holin family protein [Burkholderiales bacterium]MDE2456815.1 phage holin family protein [Burkholderiales bacterium]
MDNSPKGLLGSLRGLLDALLDLAQTRLELASTEIEEERLRISELLAWAVGALFLLGVGVVLAAMLVVLLLWDGPRELVLALLTAAFIGAGLWAGHVCRRKARAKPAFLAATIAEFARDRGAAVDRSAR